MYIYSDCLHVPVFHKHRFEVGVNCITSVCGYYADLLEGGLLTVPIAPLFLHDGPVDTLGCTPCTVK